MMMAWTGRYVLALSRLPFCNVAGRAAAVRTQVTRCSSTLPAADQEQNNGNKVEENKKESIIVKKAKKLNSLQEEGLKTNVFKFSTKSQETEMTESKSSSVNRWMAKEEFEKRYEEALLLLYNATDPNTVIDIITSELLKFQYHNVKRQICIVGISRMAQLKRNEKLKDFKSEDFNKILNYMQKYHQFYSPKETISVIRSLLKMFNEDNHIIQAFERKALSLIQTHDIAHAIELFIVHARHQQTELRKSVYNSCIKEIKSRYEEIRHPFHLCMLFSHPWRKEDFHFIMKLEDQFLMGVGEVLPIQLVQMLQLLSKKNARNKIIVQSIVTHLSVVNEKFSPTQILKILRCCVKLSIFNDSLFKGLSKDILSQLSPKALGSNMLFLDLFSKVKWCDKKLLVALLKPVLTENIPHIDRLLLSLANMNFCPEEDAVFLQKRCQNLLNNKDVYTIVQWMNIVWGLTVLQKATPELVSLVLNKEFVSAFNKCLVQEPYQNSADILKGRLVDIDCAARYELQNYSGPYLDKDFNLERSKKLKYKSDKQLRDEVVTCLRQIMPKTSSDGETYFKPDVVTKYGYEIDVEICVNKKGEIEEYKKANSDPANVYRVALLIVGFHNLIYPDNWIKGNVALDIRNLGHLGYRVVTIPNNEWVSAGPADSKKTYLKEKIRKSVL